MLKKRNTHSREQEEHKRIDAPNVRRDEPPRRAAWCSSRTRLRSRPNLHLEQRRLKMRRRGGGGGVSRCMLVLVLGAGAGAGVVLITLNLHRCCGCGCSCCGCGWCRNSVVAVAAIVAYAVLLMKMTYGCGWVKTGCFGFPLLGRHKDGSGSNRALCEQQSLFVCDHTIRALSRSMACARRACSEGPVQTCLFVFSTTIHKSTCSNTTTEQQTNLRCVRCCLYLAHGCADM